MDRHLQRSRFFLKISSDHINDNRQIDAAECLRRSASHVATAAAIHWHYTNRSRRRLQSALTCAVILAGLPLSHVDTLRQVHDVTPRHLSIIGPRQGRILLSRLHRRVHNLVNDIHQAIADNPSPPTVAEAIAALEADPAP